MIEAQKEKIKAKEMSECTFNPKLVAHSPFDYQASPVSPTRLYDITKNKVKKMLKTSQEIEFEKV